MLWVAPIVIMKFCSQLRDTVSKRYKSSASQFLTLSLVILSGLVVIMLAILPKIHGFNPGREQWIFKGDKNP
jgi:hypothetical protein